MSEYILNYPENPTNEPDPRGLGVIILEHLRTFKNRIGQIDGVTGETQTYEEIMLRSIRLAQHLQEMGITSEDIITLCSYNSFESCLPYLASQFLGIRFSALDPSMSVDDCAHLLKIVEPKLIFSDNASLDLMAKASQKAGLESEIIIFGDTSEYTPFSKFMTPTGTEHSFEAKPVKNINDTAIIFFSSGTTGLPKGICATHYGLLSKFALSNRDISNGNSTTVLLFTTFYWISATMFFMFSLFNGAQRIICKNFSVELFLKAVEVHKTSFAFLTPYQICNLLAYPDISSYDLSALNLFVVGGSITSQHQMLSLRNLLPNCIIANGYGLTETNGIATTFDIRTDLKLLGEKIISVGKPIQGFSYKIVDPETENIVGPNTHGELRLKSKTLMGGYYNNPEATAAAYDEDGYLRTGDIGYYDNDHCFYIVDRIKEMFKFQSWHILPAELEAILLTHPDIKEAAVVGVPHEIDGDHAMAAIVLKSGSCTTEEDILNFFNDQVPDRKKLRAGVKIMENLPYTPSGKLKRRCLRQTFAHPVSN